MTTMSYRDSNPWHQGTWAKIKTFRCSLYNIKLFYEYTWANILRVVSKLVIIQLVWFFIKTKKLLLLRVRNLILLEVGIQFKKRVSCGHSYTKTWSHYIYGNNFVVTINHESLKYFRNQHDLLGHKCECIDLNPRL